MAKRIFTAAAIFLLGAAYLILSYVTDMGIPCMIRVLAGVYCPGCGITRMLFSILSFDLYGAFRMNPLMFILLPFFTVFILHAVYCYIRDIPDRLYKAIPLWVYISLGAVVLIFGIIRNIPPFLFLAPTAV